jgi:hypothetical protein
MNSFKSILISFLLLATLPFCTGQGNTSLRVEIAADHKTYLLTDDITIMARLKNTGSGSLWIFKKLLWGYAGGFVLEVTDSSGNKIEAEEYDDDLVVPTTLNNPQSFLELLPDYEWGIQRRDRIGNLFRKPGRYEIRLLYRSPVPRVYFLKKPNWATEDGTIYSLPITVEVKAGK